MEQRIDEELCPKCKGKLYIASKDGSIICTNNPNAPAYHLAGNGSCSLQRWLLYFGCLRETGHYMFYSEHAQMINDPTDLEKKTGIKANLKSIFWGIDGGFVPEGTIKQGDAKESVVPPFRIVAWHDYTIDKRGKSNSAFLGVGYGSAEEMLADAAFMFPSVIKRQPVPVNFMFSNGSHNPK